jgi:hypothetical protein
MSKFRPLPKILVLVAFALIALPLSGSDAATPTNGTISEASPTIAWAGPTATTPTAGGCASANDASCDKFRLTINPPSTAFGPYQVDITLTPAAPGDWDMSVFGPSGTLVGSSGASPGVTEFVRLINPAGGTYTVAGAPFAATPNPAGSYSASATLGHYVAAAPSAGNDTTTYAVYPAPNGLGTDAGEPSIGANWNSGRTMYQAGFNTLQVSWDDCSSPAQPAWKDVTYPLTDIASLDPIGFCDSTTGRYFDAQLGGGSAFMAFTDNDGGDGSPTNWTPVADPPVTPGVDHETVGGGPYHAPLPSGVVYPHAVYYCSQALIGAFCERSDDGGVSFGPAVPIYSSFGDLCDGLHGHVKVAPNDGTVYVPNKHCGTREGLSVSNNNGLPGSWTVHTVPDTTPGAWDPSIGIATDGTLYFGLDDGDGAAKIAVSHDHGATWSTPIDVGAPVGVKTAAFPAVVAGDPNRAAFAFLGTTSGPAGAFSDNINWPSASHPAEWHLYVATTDDGGAHWTTVDLTPNDPVQRGSICGGGGLGGCVSSPNTRNLLDFMDATVDKFGRFQVGYADGCVTSSCIEGTGPNDQASLATIARQVNGKRLFAQYDITAKPDAPRVTVKELAGPPPSNLVSWDEPDYHLSPITQYTVYRSVDSGAFSVIATPAADARNYSDSNVAAGHSYAYEVTATNAQGEGGHCGDHSAGGGGALEDPCTVPGLTVATDQTGDENTTRGSSKSDIQKISVAGEFTSGANSLVFSMKVADLTGSLPLNTAWRTYWTSPNGNGYFVDMDTFVGSDNPSGGARFRYGTVTTNAAGGTLFTDTGAADGGTFSPAGLISITIAASKVGNPQPGQGLSAIKGATQLLVGAQSTGSLQPIDDAGPGAYLVRDCSSGAPRAADDKATTVENTPVTVDVLANDNDPNGETLTVVAVTDPANGAARINDDGTVTYRPNLGFTGTDTFSYTIRNESGVTASGTVTVKVSPFCAPKPTGSFTDTLEPAAKPGWTVDTAENNLGPLSPTWAVSTDAQAHSPTHSWFSDATTLDLKDDRLVAPAQDLSSTSHLVFWHRFNFEDTFDGGILEVSEDNGTTWTQVPKSAFVSGAYSGHISPSFGSPIADRDAWTGGPANAAAAAMSKVDVNLGAYAGQGVLVRFRLGTDPLAIGSLPGQGWWIDDVQFTNTLVPDNTCNRPPLVVDDSASTTKNHSVTVNVLANDTDPDGDTLAVTAVGTPKHGTAVRNGNNTITYTPATDYVGSDSFTYTASDGQGHSNQALVSISVQDVANQAPVANNDTAETLRSTAVTIDVLANDTDADGDSLTVDSVTQAAHGQVTNNGNTVTYTPEAGYVGPDSFTYKASDGKGGTSSSATVSLTVKAPPNRPPDAVDDSATTQQDTPVTINVLSNDTDQDGDRLSVTNVSDPPHGSVTNNGTSVTYTPDGGYTGTDTFTYTISDGNGGSDTARVTVEVVPTPSAGEKKVEGGGWIKDSNASDGKANFGFNAQQKGTNPPKGRISFDNGKGGIGMKGSVDTLDPKSGDGSFGGPCQLADGRACNYSVQVHDGGDKASSDTFAIQIYDLTGHVVYQNSGRLGDGNIKVQTKP